MRTAPPHASKAVALTRQTERVVILHQGPRAELRKFSSDDHSETARRLTNLFVVPQPVEIDGRFYEEKLIHRTSRREMVRSKPELIIADRLAAHGIDYAHEQPLTIGDTTKYPDFTIEDMESGENCYWANCGMLHVPQYRRRCESYRRSRQENLVRSGSKFSSTVAIGPCRVLK
jgi:hypothetical protein